MAEEYKYYPIVARYRTEDLPVMGGQDVFFLYGKDGNYLYEFNISEACTSESFSKFLFDYAYESLEEAEKHFVEYQSYLGTFLGGNFYVLQSMEVLEAKLNSSPPPIDMDIEPTEEELEMIERESQSDEDPITE